MLIVYMYICSVLFIVADCIIYLIFFVVDCAYYRYRCYYQSVIIISII